MPALEKEGSHDEKSQTLSQPPTPKEEEEPRPKFMQKSKQPSAKNQQLQRARRPRRRIPEEEEEEEEEDDYEGFDDYEYDQQRRNQVINRPQPIQQQAQKSQDSGKQPLKLRLDLNLEIEIELRAKIHGDLTLALLYVYVPRFPGTPHFLCRSGSPYLLPITANEQRLKPNSEADRVINSPTSGRACNVNASLLSRKRKVKDTGRLSPGRK
jgi:hypothetical protein